MNTDSGTEEGPVLAGVIKWFDPNRGFGFVSIDLDARMEEDSFLHSRNMSKEDAMVRWPSGTRVQYRTRITPNGKREAYDITVEK